MAVTPQNIRDRYPDLVSLADAVLNIFIADAGLQTAGAASWGAQADLAQIHLAAHLTALAYPNLAKGIVQSQSAGGVSVSYAVAPMSPEDLLRTRAGAEYLRLVRQRGYGFAVT